jgi:hypothetical protein
VLRGFDGHEGHIDGLVEGFKGKDDVEFEIRPFDGILVVWPRDWCVHRDCVPDEDPADLLPGADRWPGAADGRVHDMKYRLEKSENK